MHPVRILIADDHEIVRQGMRSLFSLRSNWEICGEAVDGREAVEKAKALKPDVILLDISMPFLNGLEAARVIHREVPQTRILIVSQHDSAHMRPKALEAGARGYVAKSDLSRDLLTAVENLLDKPKPSENAPLPPSPPVVEEQQEVTESPFECLSQGGEMGAAMRALDWSKTKLGPVANWPQSLKTSVSTCLNSRFPILIWWGPDLTMLYNDGYRQIIASKHPAALGNPGRDCWYEIWDTIGPMLDGVLYRGQPTWSDDLLLLLERHGYSEECYFTFSYSPIRDESGGVGGVFTPVNETTDKVIGERRLRTLHALATRTAHAENEDDAWKIISKVLGQNLLDIPFSILCRPGKPEEGFRIVGAAGIDSEHPLCVSLQTPGSNLIELVRKVAEPGKIAEVHDLSDYAPALPGGAWEVAAKSVLIAPLGLDEPSEILIAAVSPRKALDENYRTFFHLVAQQIANNISSARNDDHERKRSEVHSRLAAIVESSDDAIVSKDLTGIVTSWNHAAERIFGYTAAEIIGRSITLIIPPELRPEETEILRRLRAGERIDHFETVRVAKDGRKVNVSLTISPVRDGSGRIVGASKVARDITERKKTDEALQRAHEELESRVKERTAELEKAQEDLRALSTRLLQMQDEERRRIARELHDTAGQVLAALNMNLVPLEEKLQALDANLARPVTESIVLVDELSSDLRTISHLLHPPLLDEAGLASAIQWFVEGFAERSKIPVDLILDPDVGRLSADMETTIFRLVQECLTNIHRHSDSKTACIRIERDARGIRLQIRDQGRGISSAARDSRRTGVGIQGMRERVRQLGGTFDIWSGSTGTTVTALLPEVTLSARTAC